MVVLVLYVVRMEMKSQFVFQNIYIKVIKGKKS